MCLLNRLWKWNESYILCELVLYPQEKDEEEVCTLLGFVVVGLGPPR